MAHVYSFAARLENNVAFWLLALFISLCVARGVATYNGRGAVLAVIDRAIWISFDSHRAKPREKMLNFFVFFCFCVEKKTEKKKNVCS